MNEAQVSTRSNLEAFAVLIRDKRISHGGFRLWHALRAYTDHSSKCFPGQRRLAVDIGCDIHSLKAWTKELIEAGWLKVDDRKLGCGFNYTVMDGNGQPLRKTTTPTVGEKHNTTVGEKRSSGVAENHNEPLGKTTTKVSSPFNQVQLSKGIDPQEKKFIPAAERISCEKELEAIAEKRKSVNDRASHDAWGPMYSGHQKETLRELREREDQIKKILGRKF